MSARKPIIGITCSTIPMEGAVTSGIARACVNMDYITAVTLAGGVPLLLPPITDETIVREQILAIDGLILSGGPDVDPLLFGEEPLEKLGTVNHYRDRHELLAIQAAEDSRKPMLGICRGIQMLNIAYGGTLYQDLSQIEGCSIKHSQTTAQRDALWHTADLEPASALAGILGQTQLPVNSYHHQALKAVAPGFNVTARSKDGVIEAIERPGELFVLGVQWHPEILAATNPAMLALFRAFIHAASN
ncbi:gamma-glutamyl-gamma-aminobutyrate hydrolase family protein [Acetonema longum]|uniref:Putative glutamine amidotransferase n=1 Tax=Acetonema longum DSM 6540 TaxID=1009370 RepID=F7NG57_9FIRM|nr:gamma-glutamyl-gamma-aminobutyrate hydrolase family protein [Acetonema longum]EGO64975.1 putative glutamine amidotransferase [Acetonema longum DSM 6540]